MSKNQEKTKVTRIKASEASVARVPSAKQPSKKNAKATSSNSPRIKKDRSYGVLGKIGGYFKGAWLELRQVHWPTRQATWSLTGAVLLFSIFFVVFIALLDAGFKFAFEQILR